MNEDYTVIIEKKAENLYRTISQKIKNLPTSNQAVKRSISRTPQLELTPQESEQLSKYVSDDSYVKKQKEDIEELASMFKDMLCLLYTSYYGIFSAMYEFCVFSSFCIT